MKQKTYGYELVLNLFDCNLDVISSKKKLKKFADTLCDLIKMKKYGEAFIPYFGLDKPHTKGYSLVQLIETSSITGHFSEHWKTAYINIFSCQPYDHKLARKFTKEFFEAKRMTSQLLTR